MLSRERAVGRANAYLRAQGSALVTSGETTNRNRRFGVWIVGYRETARPGAPLDGGGLLVTDEGDVYDLGSEPGALDDLMIALGRWPGVEPPDAWARQGEGLALVADQDMAEAADLVAWAEARPRRSTSEE